MIVLDYLVYAIIIGYFIYWIWRGYEDRKNEAKCPSCNRFEAVVIIREELIGIFRKNYSPPIRLRGNENNPKMAWFEKYKTYCKCKYCGHEWMFFKSKRQ